MQPWPKPENVDVIQVTKTLLPDWSPLSRGVEVGDTMAGPGGQVAVNMADDPPLGGT